MDKLTDEELAQAKAVSYIHPNMYVYHDELGNITAISNVKDQTKTYLEVPEEKLTDFFNGKKDFNRFKIDYFKFFNHNTIVDETTTVSNVLVHVIPEVSDTSFKDIVVILDKTNNSLKFLINDTGKAVLYQNNLDNPVTFYITKYRNPHYLISKIVVTGHDLLNDIVLNINVDEKFSLVTTKYFNSYGLFINE